MASIASWYHSHCGRIGDLDREAQQLRFEPKDADILAELAAELKQMDATLAADESEGGVSPRATLPSAETFEFAQEMETVLQAWDFPGAGRVAWDEPRMDVTIGASRRGHQGKGLRAVTCSAFLLTLMRRCLLKLRPHLGLILGFSASGLLET